MRAAAITVTPSRWAGLAEKRRAEAVPRIRVSMSRLSIWPLAMAPPRERSGPQSYCSIQQTTLLRAAHGLGTGADAEPAVQQRGAVADSLRRDPHLPRDLCGGAAGCEQAQQLDVAAPRA